jgi:phenylalanyl-tRNA synthetase beta chain
MKVSYQWLKNYIDLDRTAVEIEEALTLIGFEVEEVVETGLPLLPNVVVGEVLSRHQHPNADRLSVCRVAVDTDGGEKRIVCGAQNYKVGDRVPVALPGAVLPGNFKIKASKLRGEPSEGMMCSAKELGISEDAQGLLILEQRPELGTPINEVFPDSDIVFDVEVTPNRPDCLSHVGIARELSAYFGLDLRYPELKHRFDRVEGDSSGLFNGVTVESKENCPHYTAHVIEGVRIAPSPDWLQSCLQKVGLRSINNVVDITNYVLLELGHPLHAFDAAKIDGRRLIVRQAADGEKITTLDEKERTLSQRMLVIADESKPLVIAGVMGSVDAEVDDTTTDIVLESAYFDPPSIRWTSRRLGLSTDSSYRFERGVDPLALTFAAQRAADLILEYAGGRLLGPRLEDGKEPVVRDEIRITHAFVREKCGFDISDGRIEEIFGALELPYHRHDGDEDLAWTVEVPSFRADLEAPIDLIEELIRIHGTGTIPSAQVRTVGIISQDNPVYTFNAEASAYLVGQHFTECVNYSLRSGEELKTWFSEAAVESFALANPLSSDQTHLRWSLIPGLLDNLKLNQARKTGATRLFESGRIFVECDGVVCEVNAVAFVMVNDPRQRAWKSREKADFYHAKKHVEVLARLAGVDLGQETVGPVSFENSAWQEGHSAAIGDVTHGFGARIGLINPFLLKRYDIQGEVVAGILEVKPDQLGQARPRPRFQPFSIYPAAERDLALVVPQDLPAEQVRKSLLQAARGAAGSSFEVERVEAFDVYQGRGLPEGQKSLAFAMTFRATDRTLTDEEVNEVFQAIQKMIVGETGFSIRQ